MMSKMIKMVFMVVIMLSTLCTFAVVQAADFSWSETYVMKDNINVVYNSVQTQGSAGVFIGTIGELRSGKDKKLIGIGGASVHINDEGKFMVTAVPVTFFDDMIQIGISMKPDNFRWNNSDDYLLSVGFSASELINKLMR